MAASSNSRLAAASRICRSSAAIAAARFAGIVEVDPVLRRRLLGSRPLGARIGHVGREPHLLHRLDDGTRRDAVLLVVAPLDVRGGGPSRRARAASSR